MEFIYFSSFTISMNFPYQLISAMCEPVLEKKKTSFGRLSSLSELVDSDCYFSAQRGRTPELEILNLFDWYYS